MVVECQATARLASQPLRQSNTAKCCYSPGYQSADLDNDANTQKDIPEVILETDKCTSFPPILPRSVFAIVPSLSPTILQR